MDQAHAIVEKVRSNYISLRKKYMVLLDPIADILEANSDQAQVIQLKKFHKEAAAIFSMERDALDDVQFDLSAIASKTMECYTSVFKGYNQVVILIFGILNGLPEGIPEGIPEAQPEAQLKAQPEAHPEAHPEAQPEPHPESQPEPQPEQQQKPEPINSVLALRQLYKVNAEMVVLEFDELKKGLVGLAESYNRTFEAIRKIGKDMEESSYRFLNEHDMTAKELETITSRLTVRARDPCSNGGLDEAPPTQEKPIPPEISTKLELIKKIRLWSRNMLYISKIETFGDDELRKFLLINAYNAKSSVAGHACMLDLYNSIDEAIIAKNLREDFPTEILKTLPPTERENGQQMIEFVGGGNSVQFWIPNDFILQKLESSYVPLNLANKDNVIGALSSLLKEDMDYYKKLETIEEVAEFINVFDALKLEFE